MWRHWQLHLPETIAKAHEAQEIAWADGLLAHVAAMKQEALAILEDAKQSPGSQGRRDALLAINKALKALELIGRIEGELRDGAQVHCDADRKPRVALSPGETPGRAGPPPCSAGGLLAAFRGDVQTIPALPAPAADLPSASGMTVSSRGCSANSGRTRKRSGRRRPRNRSAKSRWENVCAAAKPFRPVYVSRVKRRSGRSPSRPTLGCTDFIPRASPILLALQAGVANRSDLSPVRMA